MDHFFKRYPNLIITMSAAVIAFAIVFHLLFYLILPSYKPPIASSHIVMPPVASSSASASAGQLEQSAWLGWVIGVAVLTIIILLGLMALSIYGHLRNQKRSRDQQRRQDMRRLAKGFFDYRTIHGRFPLSATYRPEYYTGINLSKDWNYYGLPNAEQMKRVIPEWPISDPSIDYNGTNQVNQYLYYPRNEGRTFDLYAHLELPLATEQQDYNQLDNLLRSWGSYNYKVSSESLPQNGVPAGPAVVPTDLPLPQAIVEQTIPEAEEINADIQFLADEVVATPKPALPPAVPSYSKTVTGTTQDQVAQLGQAVADQQQRKENESVLAPILPGDELV